MKFTIARQDLTKALAKVSRVVESRNTIPILGYLLISANAENITITGTDLSISATSHADAKITTQGSVCVDARLINDIAKKAGDVNISFDVDGSKLILKSGRSKFTLETLPATDFPVMTDNDYVATFNLDIAALFAPVAFAMSNEAQRYYLNGIFFHVADGYATAVATNGHRLAKNTGPELQEIPEVIVPSKAISIIPKGEVEVSISDRKIKFVSPDFTMITTLIDGTYPDYRRVIPTANSKIAFVDKEEFMRAADRVVTVSKERARAVKLSLANGSISFSARSDAGTANDEVEAKYSDEPMSIGINSQYLRDMFAVLPAGEVKMQFNDANAPVLVSGLVDGWIGILMPTRV